MADAEPEVVAFEKAVNDAIGVTRPSVDQALFIAGVRLLSKQLQDVADAVTASRGRK